MWVGDNSIKGWWTFENFAENARKRHWAIVGRRGVITLPGFKNGGDISDFKKMRESRRLKRSIEDG